MTAMQAQAAWQAGNRRRRAAEGLERAADAALAAGALLVANVVLPLRLGLPAGRAGMIAAAALLCIGIALIARKRPIRPEPRRVAVRTVRAMVPAERAA